MLARPRRAALPACATLAASLRGAPTLEAKQDLLDFEISIGPYDDINRQWLIEHSTLPFKEGRRWWLSFSSADSDIVAFEDLDPHGGASRVRWQVVARDDRSMVDDRQSGRPW